MNLRSTGVVFRKELVDTLRDHRFLVTSIVVPLLSFPVLILGFGSLMFIVATRAVTQDQKVMILNAPDAPDLKHRLEEVKNFDVVAEAPDYTQRINDKKLQAVVDVPEGLEEKLRTSPNEAQTLRIYHFEGELRSSATVRTLRREISAYVDHLVKGRLTGRGLSIELLTPFKYEQANVAPAERVSGNILGLMLPYFVIIFALTGAMYPAMDLTAGEKERGTIETILASPTSRMNIVLGKFALVLLVALVTTILSLASFAGTAMVGAQLLQRANVNFFIVVSAKAIAAVFFMVLPLAIFFSAALMAIAIVARNYKEAQSYLQPLMFVVIFPAMASFIPGVQLNTALALVPVLNVSLVAREIFAGQYPWNHIGLILGTTCVYAAAAIYFAVRQFQKEEVLFRA
jgi:sodium transport system permease protein